MEKLHGSINSPHNEIPAEDVHFVRYDERFLELSWQWFQDSEFRHMTTTAPFTKAQQQAWFAGIDSRDDYRVWGIEATGIPIGAFGLKNITDEAAEYWGYIGNRDFWGRGVGKLLIAAAVAFAKEHRLKRLYLRTAADNTRSLSLYRKCGFREVSNTGEVVEMELVI